MSDVTRYVAAGDGVVKTDPAGPLVKWDDYARLQAENDALKLGSLLTAVDVLQFINLKAEVERLTEQLNRHLEINDELDARCTRLRKAGDAMANWFCPVAGAKSLPAHIVYEAWNAAKEGKPTEQKSPSFIEDLGNGVEKHDLLFRYPAKEGKQP